MKNNQYTATPNWFKDTTTSLTGSLVGLQVTNYYIQGGSSSGGTIDMSQVWEALAADTTEQINKSHLTDALKDIGLEGDFVDLTSDQDITGIKNFINGLKISDKLINIVDGVLYLDCNVAVTGGLTVYAQGTQDIPSIWDGAPFDNVTIHYNEETGLIEVIGGTGGVSNWEDLQGKPEWITDTAPNNNIFPNTANYWVADNNKILSWDNAASKSHEHANKATLDKIYEKDGVIYWDGSLAVTGGITAYALGSVDVSTIMDGVVVDGTTIKKENGKLVVIGGSGSSFDEDAMWSALSAATNEQINKSHLTDALSGYALQTSLDAVSAKLNDFLEGSDTDTIINKWKELEAFLAGMSETDNLAEILATKSDKSYVDTEFKKYVTLATAQSISGAKTFTSLLTTAAITASGDISTPNVRTADSVYINGIRLYKSADGTIKIDGNLLVTGGITAYSTGDEGGSSGGGGIDVELLWEILGGTGTQQINVTHLTGALTWNNISNKPSWIGDTKPSYNWSEIGSKPTTLGGYGITDAYTKTDSDSRFVNVSGDTITGDLTIQRLTISHSNEINSTDYVYLGYRDTPQGINVCHNNKPFTYGSSGYTVWHAGNMGHNSGLNADLLDGVHEASLTRFVLSPCADGMTAESAKSYFSNSAVAGRVTTAYNVPGAEKTAIFGKSTGNYGHILMWGYDDTYLRMLRLYAGTWKSSDWEKISAGNADRLTTARTIWGKSFDGTGNVSGELSQCTRIYNAASNPIYIGNSNNSSWVYTQDIASSSGYDKWAININGIANFQKVNIGYTYPNEGAHLLNVNGTAKANALMSYHIRIECDNNGVFGSRGGEINNYDTPLQLQYNTSNQLHLCMGGGNVGIGTTTPDQRLTVNGNTHITGNNVFDGYTIYQPNTKCLWLRNSDNWHSGIGYDTTGTECMAFGVQNTGTKFKFKVGFDWSTFVGGGSYSNMTNADLEIGAGYVSMALGHSSQALRFENRNEINCYNGYLYLNHRGNGGSLGSTSHIIMCANGNNVGIGTASPSAKLHVAGDILATGGITCYASDQRAKTVIEQISLSLKQIANAPTIRFKWNNWKIKDDGKTHIGGIAQYVQKLLPETVLEADGILNLDYATTGYIFAVQTAKHLVKTDTEVERLKKRVKKLEKQLKQLGYEEADIISD